MDFYEIPYAEGVVCTGRSAQVFPDTDAGTVAGRAVYQFQNASGREQTAAFGVTPGYTVSSVRINEEEAPFQVSSYQEFNEAMLEITLPAEAQAEVAVE